MIEHQICMSAEQHERRERMLAEFVRLARELGGPDVEASLQKIQRLRGALTAQADSYKDLAGTVLTAMPVERRVAALDFNAPFYRLTGGETYELRPFAATVIRLERDESLNASGQMDNQNGLALHVLGTGNFSVSLSSAARPNGMTQDGLAMALRVMGCHGTQENHNLPALFYVVIDPKTQKVGGVVRQDGREHAWFYSSEPTPYAQYVESGRIAIKGKTAGQIVEEHVTDAVAQSRRMMAESAHSVDPKPMSE